MRLSGLCAALAAASLASAQTITITRTVERVKAATWPTSSVMHKNGTAPTLHTGTGVWDAASSSAIQPTSTQKVQPATGAAVPIRLDTLGFVAAAGLAGLVAL